MLNGCYTKETFRVKPVNENPPPSLSLSPQHQTDLSNTDQLPLFRPRSQLTSSLTDPTC